MVISPDTQLNKDVIFSNDSDLQNKAIGESKGCGRGSKFFQFHAVSFWGSFAKWPVGATVPEGWRPQLGEILNPALNVMLSKRNSMVWTQLESFKRTLELIPKLAMITLSVHCEPLKIISLENASASWNFYCSPTNVFVLWLSGYVQTPVAVRVVRCHQCHPLINKFNQFSVSELSEKNLPFLMISADWGI